MVRVEAARERHDTDDDVDGGDDRERGVAGAMPLADCTAAPAVISVNPAMTIAA